MTQNVEQKAELYELLAIELDEAASLLRSASDCLWKNNMKDGAEMALKSKLQVKSVIQTIEKKEIEVEGAQQVDA